MNNTKAMKTIKVLFSILMLTVILVPVLFIVTNSFMSRFEVFQRYTETITPYNILNTYDDVHFVEMTLIPIKVSFEQYIDALIYDANYLKKFVNSIVLTVPIVVLNVIISSVTAFSFEYAKFRFKELIYYIYIVIMFLPLQVTLVSNYFVIDYMGLNQTIYAVILPAIFNPFGVFIIRQFLKGVPYSFIEAAKIDGANTLQVLFYIIVPIAKIAIVSLVLLLTIEYWNIVEQADLFLAGTSQMPLSAYLASQGSGNIELIFAQSTYYMILPICIFLFGVDYMVEGIQLTGK